MNNITRLLDNATLLEQLAEEASELAQAALKHARILRRNNPTTVTSEEAMANLIEEYSDVVLCARVLILQPDEDLIDEKMKRWNNAIILHNDKEAAMWRKGLL